METMSQFNNGNRVLVTSLNPTASSEIKIGDVRTVTDTCVDMVRLDNILAGWLFHSNIELVPEDIKPKWTIYNNTLPWSQLSDKQKCKMLLGDHKGIKFTIDNVAFTRVGFTGGSSVYKAIKPEPVKPEPTMAELFMADLSECNTGLLKHIPEPMIAKGWTKPCK
jgi:hypothetical protein